MGIKYDLKDATIYFTGLNTISDHLIQTFKLRGAQKLLSLQNTRWKSPVTLSVTNILIITMYEQK